VRRAVSNGSRRARPLRTAVAVGILAVTVLGAGVGAAFGYWRSSAQGSGTATAGTLLPVTVTALVGGDAPTSVLLPGSSADVILRVNNPNSYSVTLRTVTGNGAITADAGHSACTTTGVTFTNQTNLSVTIGASGTTLVHLAGAASMSNASSSGCQGATFSVPVAITVQK